MQPLKIMLASTLNTDGFLEYSPSGGSLYYRGAYRPEDNSDAFLGLHLYYVSILINMV